VREGTEWTQRGYLKARSVQSDATFGHAVAVDEYIVLGAQSISATVFDKDFPTTTGTTGTTATTEPQEVQQVPQVQW
jgi:hypothetical protein